MRAIARIVAVALSTLGVFEGFMYFVALFKPHSIISALSGGYNSDSRFLQILSPEHTFHYGMMAMASLGLSGIILAILATRPNE